MSLSERASDRRLFTRLPAVRETTLLGIIAVCFLMLHVAAFMLVAPARQSDAAGPPPVPLSRGD